MDLAGTVVSVGPSVTKFKPGDEIYTKAPEAYHGAVAEYALADADTTVLKPQSLNFVDAASIPLVGQTSLESFRLAETLVEGGLKGKTVLVPGALSGTGLVAIQLAKIFGAAKIITTLSPGKLARAKEFFGEEGIEYVDYTTGNVVAQIGTGTVDFLYDTMGVGPTYLPVIKKGGAVVSITALPSGDYAAKNFPEVPMLIRWALTAMDAWNRRKYRAAGVGFGYVILQPTLQMMEDLDRWVGEGKLKTLVGKTAKLGDLEEVKKGCQAILDGKGGVGKFVIEID
jgi:NADPH:quinone reductase-like Zn-dependent oxidoreductase